MILTLSGKNGKGLGGFRIEVTIKAKHLNEAVRLVPWARRNQHVPKRTDSA